MKLLKLLRTETARLLLMGFAVGTIGLALAQPSTAQADQRAIATTAP